MVCEEKKRYWFSPSLCVFEFCIEKPQTPIRLPLHGLPRVMAPLWLCVPAESHRVGGGVNQKISGVLGLIG